MESNEVNARLVAALNSLREESAKDGVEHAVLIDRGTGEIARHLDGDGVHVDLISLRDIVTGNPGRYAVLHSHPVPTGLSVPDMQFSAGAKVPVYAIDAEGSVTWVSHADPKFASLIGDLFGVGTYVREERWIAERHPEVLRSDSITPNNSEGNVWKGIGVVAHFTAVDLAKSGALDYHFHLAPEAEERIATYAAEGNHPAPKDTAGYATEVTMA